MLSHRHDNSRITPDTLKGTKILRFQFQVDILENTNVETLESIDELENTDLELIQRLDEIESNINGTSDSELEERVQALEEVDNEFDQRLDEVEALVNQTSGGDLEVRVEALEEADDDINIRIDGIEEEIGAGEGSANDSLPQCYGGYTTLTDDYRRVGQIGSYCDRDVIEDGWWYRFSVSTGENGLLDSCVPDGFCGGSGPIWMTTKHPKVIGQLMQSSVVVSNGGDCDYSTWGGDIEVTKCYVGGERFYLYKMWKPTVCPISYCVRRYDDI